MSVLLHKVTAVRDEAWEAVLASAEYMEFVALDEAVYRMGGQPKLALPPTTAGDIFNRVFEHATKKMTDSGKRKQGDAAEIALRVAKMPLPVGELMIAAGNHGAEIGGTDPLNNFRSTISKDPRFRSLKANGAFYWWLTAEPVPPREDEATTPDLIEQVAASSIHNNQEGGDGHGPATN